MGRKERPMPLSALTWRADIPAEENVPESTLHYPKAPHLGVCQDVAQSLLRASFAETSTSTIEAVKSVAHVVDSAAAAVEAAAAFASPETPLGGGGLLVNASLLFAARAAALDEELETTTEEDTSKPVSAADEEEEDDDDDDEHEEEEDEEFSGPREGFVMPDVLPSVGSAGHADGTCKRCCFFPKGRCENAADCEFCHFDHEKRKRLNKKKKKRENRRAAAAATGDAEDYNPPTPSEEEEHLDGADLLKLLREGPAPPPAGWDFGQPPPAHYLESADPPPPPFPEYPHQHHYHHHQPFPQEIQMAAAPSPAEFGQFPPNTAMPHFGGYHVPDYLPPPCGRAPAPAPAPAPMATGGPPVLGEVALPPGWAVFFDDRGVPYYHNQATGQTQWEQPSCFPAPPPPQHLWAPPQPAAAPNRPPPYMAPNGELVGSPPWLPPGWKEVTKPSGERYYWDGAGVVSWAVPVSGPQPPPAPPLMAETYDYAFAAPGPAAPPAPLPTEYGQVLPHPQTMPTEMAFAPPMPLQNFPAQNFPDPTGWKLRWGDHTPPQETPTPPAETAAAAPASSQVDEEKLQDRLATVLARELACSTAEEAAGLFSWPVAGPALAASYAQVAGLPAAPTMTGLRALGPNRSAQLPPASKHLAQMLPKVSAAMSPQIIPARPPPQASFRDEEDDEEEDEDEEEEDEEPFVMPDVLPSVGSAGHADGSCKRCCFFPKGRCENAADCEFCHFDHEKRKRLNKKKKKKKAGRSNPQEGSSPSSLEGASNPSTIHAGYSVSSMGGHGAGQQLLAMLHSQR